MIVREVDVNTPHPTQQTLHVGVHSCTKKADKANIDDLDFFPNVLRQFYHLHFRPGTESYQRQRMRVLPWMSYSHPKCTLSKRAEKEGRGMGNCSQDRRVREPTIPEPYVLNSTSCMDQNSSMLNYYVNSTTLMFGSSFIINFAQYVSHLCAQTSSLALE